MNSDDEHAESDMFDIPNSVNTQLFAPDSDQFKPSLSDNSLYDNYLRENIGKPLSNALSYVIIYRPEDPIEFIANFLIDWSRKNVHQEMMNQKINNISMECFTDEQQQQEQQIDVEYDKHLFTTNQEDLRIKSHTDDERELSSSFQEQKQSTHRTNTSSYIHMHDTASGLDDDDNDETKSNQKNNKNHICHDNNPSSFTYFSKLRDKIIKCDEF